MMVAACVKRARRPAPARGKECKPIRRHLWRGSTALARRRDPSRHLRDLALGIPESGSGLAEPDRPAAHQYPPTPDHSNSPTKGLAILPEHPACRTAVLPGAL